MAKLPAFLFLLFFSLFLSARDSLPAADSTAPLLSPEKTAMRSVLLPGYGQWSNRQFVKAPLMFSLAASGVYGSVRFSLLSSAYEKSTLVRIGQNTLLDDPYPGLSNMEVFRNTFRYGDYKRYSVFFTLYAYGINALDAYVVARLKQAPQDHAPLRAAYYSVLLPGLGQLYNRKYWKAPLAFGLVATAAGFSAYYNGFYRDFALAYATRTDDDPLSEYETGFTSAYLTSQLRSEAEQWKNYRDMAYLATVGIYLLNVVDAIVDAHLYNFDLSDDLSKKKEGKRLRLMPFAALSYPGDPVNGMTLSLEF